jgi:hypothetical protein
LRSRRLVDGKHLQIYSDGRRFDPHSSRERENLVSLLSFVLLFNNCIIYIFYEVNRSMDAALLAVMALKRWVLEEPKEEEEFGRRGAANLVDLHHHHTSCMAGTGV